MGRRSLAGFAWVRLVFAVAYVVAVGYLCAVALSPTLAAALPQVVAWFARPGSFATLLTVLALPVLYLLLRRVAGRQVFSGGPLFVISGMVVSTVVLGMSAYWNCHGGQSPFFAPLTWTLGLFVGSVENPFDGATEAGCGALPMPVALELARLLGIAATLTTAVAAVMTLFRSQVDRIAIWRARSLVVVVGIDDQAVSLIAAIQRNKSVNEVVVVLTRNEDRDAVDVVRRLGVKAREIDLDDERSLTSLKLWQRLDRLYLLSEDPARNLNRYNMIDRHFDRLRQDRLRLPLTVRIEDPWQAEQWRRSFLSGGERRWVADAVGPYEISAARLVRHLIRPDGDTPTDTVLLCGLNELTHAVTSEFAQVWRESQLYVRPGTHLPPRVTIFARGAESFVKDHDLKQQSMATDVPMLTVTPHGVDAGVTEIDAYFEELTLQGSTTSACAVVLTDPAMEHARIATRLALRFPDVRIYQASVVAEALTNTSVIGRVYTYPVNMDLDTDAPQDIWERAAELIHEDYCKTMNRDTPTTREWRDLDSFVKGSNRRQVLNMLWMVEKLTDLTWNSLQGPPAEPLPAGLTQKPVKEQLEWMGLSGDVALKLAEAEHEDWFRYHEANGWSAGAVDDPVQAYDRKVHERLLPWRELMASDAREDNESRALASLLTCLRNLRSLGYRAVPKWLRYRRVGEVVAEQRTSDWTWTTANGDVLTGTAGDWLVTDDTGDERSVATDIFTSSHEHVSGNRYRRSGTVEARRVVGTEVVHTLEGDTVASPGDYVVKGTAGEQWPVPRDKFLESYELVDDE